MTYRHYCVISASLFSLVAAAHLLRVVFAIPVLVGAVDIPLALSWVGFIVPGTLAALGFRAAGKPA